LTLIATSAMLFLRMMLYNIFRKGGNHNGKSGIVGDWAEADS
jgi:hypothetical protein